MSSPNHFPIKKHRLKLLLLMFLLFSFSSLFSAPLKNVPQLLKQPNGEIVACFASGDEFYHWLHDKDDYTIVQNQQNGYFVYASRIKGEIVATDYIVGQVNPKNIGLEKGIRISESEYLLKKKSFFSSSKLRRGTLGPKTGLLNNLVVFIQFSDDSDFVQPSSFYEDRLNSQATGFNSVYNYYMEASYGKMRVVSSIYPAPTGGKMVPYKDPNPRSYYQKYNATTNPGGYQNEDEMGTRKNTLCINALKSIESAIPSSLNIDADNDGKIDAICFLVKGKEDGWGDLLWPTQSTLDPGTYKITGKTPDVFSFQFEFTEVATICHETFHVMGAEDLYHYKNQGKLAPVGSWDLMESSTDPAQHMCTYMKFKVTKWIDEIPEIKTTGTYTLNPISSTTNNCYKIKSPNSTNEYFVVEYRKKTAAAFESLLPGSGLLVYRINSTVNGNSNGPPDEVYAYRPNGVATLDGANEAANGIVENAYLSLESGRISINDNTNPSGFLTNGSAGGLNISEISSAGNTISFKVTLSSTVTTYSISGTIKDAANNPLNNVDVALTGGATKSTKTGADGKYSFDNLDANNNYTITPSKAGYTFNPATKTFTSLNANQTQDFTGSAAVAVLNSPESVVFDQTNNRYLASNAGDGKVVSISSSGTAQSTTNFVGYRGMTVYNNILYTVAGDKSIKGYKLSDGTTVLEKDIPEAGFLNDITADASGNLYITDTGNDKIFKFTVSTGTVSTLVSSGISQPNGILFESDKNRLLFVSMNPTAQPIQAIDLTTLAVTTVATPGYSQMDGIQSDNQGNYYITSWTTNIVYKLDQNFANAQVYSTGHDGPADIFFDNAASLLFIPNFNKNTIDVKTITPVVSTYKISGVIKDNQSNPIQDVAVSISGGKTATVQTGADGTYKFENLDAAKSYTVTPAKQGYTFNPTSKTFDNLSSNQTQDFVGTPPAVVTYMISGVIKDNQSNAISGVTVSLTGGKSSTVQTGTDGTYRFETLDAAKSYTITPAKQGYTFDPTSKTFDNLSSNQTQDFVGTPPAVVTYTISGLVKDNQSNPIKDVTVSISGGKTATVQTGTDGSYKFETLDAAKSYTITPTKQNYTFIPVNKTFDNLSGNQTQDFVGATSVGVKEYSNVIPNEISLYQNYPNPFNPSTNITFALPTASFVKVQVFNTLGQVISTLYEGYLISGTHQIEFNAANMTSGIYYTRLIVGNTIKSITMNLLK